MEGPKEQTQRIKRIVLASGKTIDVVYFEGASPAPASAPTPAVQPDQKLHLCLDCGSHLVHPVEWQEAGPTNWTVFLHCPNCETNRQGVFSQDTVEAFDDELDRGADALARDYKRLMRANMADELERFSAALQADAILPEDF